MILSLLIIHCQRHGFKIWVQVEREACATRAPNFTVLKDPVAKAWHNLDPAYIRTILGPSEAVIEAVIEADGSKIE